MARPKISVLTPVYNRADCIGRCISSVMKQEGFTHVVVDDGSTDDTYRMLQEHKDKYRDRVQVICYSTNRGINYALNRGVEKVGSGFVLILGSDDYLLDGASQTIRKYMNENPGYLHYLFVPDDKAGYVTANSLVKTKVSEVRFADWLSEKISGDFVHVIHASVLKRFPFFEEFRLYEGINFLRFYKFTERQLVINEVIVGRERDRKDALTREGTLYKAGAMENEFKALGLRLNLLTDDYLKFSPHKYHEVMKRYLVLGVALSKYRELGGHYQRFNPALKVLYKLRLGILLKFLIRSYSFQKAALHRLRKHPRETV